MEQVVSFDLDGTLHSSVQDYGFRGVHPLNHQSPALWKPNDEVITRLREEAETNTVVIVSARDDDNLPYIEKFVEMHNLPVSEIYLTNDKPKLSVLKSINAIRHYDDIDLSNMLKGSGVDFIHVVNGKLPAVKENMVSDVVDDLKSKENKGELGQIADDLGKGDKRPIAALISDLKSHTNPDELAQMMSSLRSVNNEDELQQMVADLRGKMNKDEVQQIVMSLRHPANG